MSLFMKDKPVQAGPSWIKAIQAGWRDAVAQAEKVAIVGVRPNPMDEHLWEAVAATAAEVLFIGDEAAITGWASQYRRTAGPTRILGARFDQAIDELLGLWI
jgi:hypothetical protein